MKYKLVAIDMDGTLLTSEKIITPAVVEAVRRAEASGAVICLSSGRPYCGLKRYIEQIGLTSPVITCNGAVVTDCKGAVLFRRHLSEAAAGIILDYAERFDTTVCAWSGDRLLVNWLNKRTEHYEWLSDAVASKVSREEMIESGLDKILWHDEAELILKYQAIIENDLRELAEKGEPKPEFVFFNSNPFLEFVNSSVSKAITLEQTAQQLGIKREEVIAIGDAFNDLEMLKWAGLSIAMGNAHDEIKQVCGWVAPSNNEDGVAAALEKFILCGE